MLRSSDNWNSTPGNFDALNTETIFESNNKYGIPEMLPCEIIPDSLVPYGTEVRRGYAQTKGKCVHFFLDDYKFESLWSKPIKTSAPIEKIGLALSPDFSMYTDYPRVMQIWNTYRNRWLGRYWQSQNVEVIPTIGWSDEESFDYCFLGIPKNSVVAIGTVGVNSKEKKELFKKGYERMLEQLEPLAVLVYGESEPVDFESYGVPVHKYPSYWKARRRQLQKDKEQLETLQQNVDEV